MADWGLYSALRGTDNWAQRRADKQVNMQIAEKQLERENQKTQQSMLAEEEIQKYMDEMAAIDVLPEDQDRIKEVERNARTNIVQGIARYNGDLTRYISSGGITDLHDYKNSIIQSGEVKTALSNKENMAKIIADKQQGNRWFKPIQKEVPIIGEDGQPTGETEVKTYNMDQQLAAFKNGEINTIDYMGSENKVAINAMTFKQFPKNPRKPYSDDNRVSANDVMFQAMEAGASEDYAYELAASYSARVKANPNAVWYWGNKSDEERMFSLAKTAKMAGATGGKGGGESLPDYYKQALTGAGAGTQTSTGTFKEFQTEKGVGAKYQKHHLTAPQYEMLTSAIGLNPAEITDKNIFKDGKYLDAKDVQDKVRVAGDKVISPRSGKEYSFQGTNYTLTNLGKDVYNIGGKKYLEGTIYADENALDSSGGNGMIEEAGIDHIVGDMKGDNLIKQVNTTYFTAMGESLGPNPDYLIKVFVPLNDSPGASSYYTKKMGAGEKWEEEWGVEGTDRGLDARDDEFMQSFE